jgi:hypothetical protein
MRVIQCIVVICLFLFSACKNNRRDAENIQIPEAMQESKKSTIMYKRVNDDMVNSIYNNLLEKSPELKTLDDQVSNLRDERLDSASALLAYIEKNNEYYYSAEEHVKSISDSLLRKQILNILNTSRKKSDSSIISHHNLLGSIDNTIKQITDQREGLKVLLSLPVIEEYQKLNLPSKKPLEELNKKTRDLKTKMDSVIRKNGA